MESSLENTLKFMQGIRHRLSSGIHTVESAMVQSQDPELDALQSEGLQRIIEVLDSLDVEIKRLLELQK